MSHSTYPKSNGLCIIFHLLVEFLNLVLSKYVSYLNHNLTRDLTRDWIDLQLIRLVNNLSDGCGVFDGGIIKIYDLIHGLTCDWIDL